MSPTSLAFPNDIITLVVLQATAMMALAVLCASAFSRRAALRSFIHLASMSCAFLGPVALITCSLAGWTLPLPLPGQIETPSQAMSASAGPSQQSLENGDGASRVAGLPNATSANDLQGSSWHSGSYIKPCLLAAWGCGAISLGFGIAVSVLRLCSLLRTVVPLQGTEYRDAIRTATNNLGANEYPRVGITNRIASPVAVGSFGNAWVLLPQKCLDVMSHDQLVHVLTHEGAHVLRRDPLIRLLQRIHLALWWWNPLAHIQNSQLSRSREEICDNVVLDRVDCNAYSMTLLELGKLIASEKNLVGSVGLFGSRWSLESRIKGILNPGRDKMVKANRIGIAFVLVAFVAVTMITSVTRITAQESRDNAGPPESTSSLRPVDLHIAIEPTGTSTSKMLVSAKERIEFKTLNSILGTLPAVDDKHVFLTVVSADEELHAPRTTGDQQIGINLSSDPIEVFVTDGMPYSVTSRVCEALAETVKPKAVVLKSTHRLSKQFIKEQREKHGPPSDDDPFGN